MNAPCPPSLIAFADPLPAPVTDRPAAERVVGPAPGPLRTTREAYSAEDGAISMGEWCCEPGAWRVAFHAGRHEFFHVLEGRLRLLDEAGNTREFGPGDACIIPAGFRGEFHVLEPVRKRYVMIDRPAG